MEASHPLLHASAAYGFEEPKASRAHIVCTTDFSDDGKAVFHHALRLALAGPSRLTLLHVGPESRDGVAWNRFPAVRDTLVRWGRLPAGCEKSAVAERLDIQVSKISMRDEDHAAGIIDFVSGKETHLIVMAHVPSGRHRPLRSGPTSLRVLRNCRVPTLILPMAEAGFVDGPSGRTLLRRVVVPVDHEPDARPALALTGALCAALSGDTVDAEALYVGDPDDGPEYLLGSNDRCSWHWHYASGEVVDVVAAQDADLVVVPTEGPRGLREKLTGSTFDRLLDRARSPLLALPVFDEAWE